MSFPDQLTYLKNLSLMVSVVQVGAESAAVSLDKVGTSAARIDTSQLTAAQQNTNTLQSQLEQIRKLIGGTMIFQAPERLELIIKELRQLNDPNLDIRTRLVIQRDLIEEDKYLRTFSGGQFSLARLRDLVAALDHALADQKSGGKVIATKNTTGQAGTPSQQGGGLTIGSLTTAATKGTVGA